jgi:hypothetical protein
VTLKILLGTNRGNYVKESSQFDVEKYLLMCEQLGQEPDPAKMPLDSSDFPEEVQVAFFIFSLLSDNWDGMSGTYLGKDWTQCTQLFELYEVENKKETLFFMKLYENIIVSYKSEEAEKKRKAEERKAKSAGGGKQYTHNVRG